MRLTVYTDYTLRVMIYLTLKYQGGEVATIDEMARAYDISRNHLMKIVNELSQSGFIETTRGRAGGARLARAPLGSAALDLAWTACGRYDGYWEMGLAPWDVAAGTVIVREAGGVAEDLRHIDPWPLKGYVYAGNANTAPALDAMVQPHLARR